MRSPLGLESLEIENDMPKDLSMELLDEQLSVFCPGLKEGLEKAVGR